MGMKIFLGGIMEKEPCLAARLFQTVEKTYIILKNGVWGVAPSGVRAAAPHSAPFPGKGVWG